ncbi:MAG: hypothetical protein AMJ81_11090 [Phycisphaerae bacterium SM23_33]|nr:MAG: hypothetical protein AMJ81_11090 [Phycisphaerae bacterium SM23_33]
MRNRQPTAVRRPSAPGFTLLEAVLAVALAVILVGTVYAFYRHTLGVRQALHEQADTLLAQRRILDMMAEDVQSAVVYSTLGVGLNGTVEEFSVARAVVPSQAVYLTAELIRARPGVWEEPSEQDKAFQPQHDVQLVSYRLNRYTDEEGVEQIGGLERLCQRTILAETAEEGTNVETVLLSAHTRFCRLQYWDGSQWTESWARPAMPQAVRIDLGVQPLEEGLEPREYPYETTWRVIAIPAAAAGGGARPAGGGPRPGGEGAGEAGGGPEQ